MRNGRGEADLSAQRRDHEGPRVEHDHEPSVSQVGFDVRAKCAQRGFGLGRLGLRNRRGRRRRARHRRLYDFDRHTPNTRLPICPSKESVYF